MAITAIRNDLIAEHTGRSVGEVADNISRLGLIAGLDALRGNGRALIAYVPNELMAYEQTLAENELVDPENPPHLWRGLGELLGLRRPGWRRQSQSAFGRPRDKA
jgi:hypothetical protein